MRGDSACRDLFLGDDGNARCRFGQRRENDQLRRSIGFGHRRAVAFSLDLEPAPDDREDCLARFARGVGQLIEQLRIVARQRGAIRMPPSSRTAAAFM